MACLRISWLVWLVVALAITGCSSSFAPRPGDAVIPPLVVRDALFDRPTGNLLLTSEGLWAYVPDAPAALTTLDTRTGALLEFAPAAAPEQPHLFAVVAARAWGLELQRLDTHPINRRDLRGVLETLDAAATAHVCLGASAPENAASLETSACLERFAHGRWDVYPLAPAADGGPSAPRLEVAAAVPDAGGLLPFRRLAQVHVDGDGEREIMGAEAGAPGAWIAIARLEPLAPLPAARIALGPDCALSAMPAGLPFATLPAALDASALVHPLQIESRALALGVDAFVMCEGGATIVATPAMERPLVTAGGTPIASSLLGWKPLVLAAPASAKGNDDARAWAAALSAASATGDFVAADFFLERLLEAATPADARTIGLRAMQLAAAADRPEAALRMGQAATSRSWNPGGQALYRLGLAFVYAALGLDDQALAHLGAVPGLLERNVHDDLGLWMQWDAQRVRRARGQRIAMHELEQIERAAADRPLWALTMRMIALEVDDVATYGQAARTNVRARVDAHGVGPLWHFFEATAADDENDDDDDDDAAESAALPPAVYAAAYGDVASAERIAAALRRAPVSGLRAAHRLDHLHAHLTPADATERPDPPRLDALLAGYPTLRGRDQDRAFDEAARLLGAWMRADRPGLCAARRALANRALEARLRDRRANHAPSAQARGEVLEELFGAGVEAACEDGGEHFEATVAPWFRRSGDAAGAIAPLVVGFVEGQPALTLAPATLGRWTTFASQHGLHDACRRWSLGLSTAYLQAGQLDRAQASLTELANCGGSRTGASGPGDDALARSQRVLATVLSWQRAGVVAPLELDAEGQIACVGVRTMRVDLLDQLDAGVVHVARLVALDAQATEMPEGRAFGPVDVPAEERDGLAAYQVGRRALAEGRPAVAANAFAQARAHLAPIQHGPALARLAFLEEYLFDGSFTADMPAAREPAVREPAVREPAARQTWARLPSGIVAADGQIVWARLRVEHLPALLRSGFARRWLDEHDAWASGLDHTALAHARLAASLIVEAESQTRARLEALGPRLAPGALCGDRGIDKVGRTP